MPDDDDLIERLKARIEAGHGLDRIARELERREVPSPPASVADIEATERLLDAPLPPLLRRIYHEVANGGFGPSYGLLGVHGGYRNSVATLGESYRSLRDRAGLHWPRGLLTLVNLGCAQYICLATDEHADAIVIHDSGRLTITPFSLHHVCSTWCNGAIAWRSMHVDAGELVREGFNPATKDRQIFRKRILRAVGFDWPGYPQPE